MRSTLVVLSLTALGLLVYYGGFIVGPKIQAGVQASAVAAAQKIDSGAEVKLFALDATLTGSIASEEAREGVKRAVERVAGVRKVIDKLVVAGAAAVDVVPTPDPVEPPVVIVAEPDVAEAVIDDADVSGGDDVAMVDEDVVDEDAVDDEVIAAEDVGPDEVTAEDVEALSLDTIEAAPALPVMVSLKWDGAKLVAAGAGSKALVASLNELMLSDYVADDFVGEVAETETAPPPGFDVGAKTLTQLLATTKSGSFVLEDKSLKVDVVVADAPAKAKFLRGLARVSGRYKREVNIVIAPPPAPEVKPEPEVAPEPVAPTPATVKDPGGALTNAQCQSLIAAAIDGPGKQFTFTRPNSSRLSPEGITKANEIAALLKRCPEAKGVIEGFHHNQGDPDEIRTLTRKRAFSVHAAIVAAGIDAKRFTYQGMGYNFPKYSNKLETRHLNERVEFKLGVD